MQLRQLEKQLEQNQLTPEMKKVLERLRNEQLTNHERFEAQKLEVCTTARPTNCPAREGLRFAISSLGRCTSFR